MFRGPSSQRARVLRRLFKENNIVFNVSIMKDFGGENTKGIALVRMADGNEVYQPKITYLRMKYAKNPRNVILIAEAPTLEELKKKIGRP